MGKYLSRADIAQFCEEHEMLVRDVDSTIGKRWRREFGQLGKWKKLGSESAIMAGK
jgi:hypothetical protein